MGGSSAVGLRHAGWCAALDPVEHVSRVKTPTAHAESLRREQAARVCAPHGLFVATDVLGDLECCQKSVREAASCRGIVFTGVVIVTNKFLVDVQVFPIASSESVAPLWTAPMTMVRREPVGAAVSDGP